MSELRFNLLLEAAGLDPKNVSVILHTTSLQPLRRMLPWMAAERPDLFEAYQSVHSPKAEAGLRKRPYAASFVPLPGGDLVFEGLYNIEKFKKKPTREIYADTRFDELETRFGATDISPVQKIALAPHQIQFDFVLCKSLRGLIGRLQIHSPPGMAYVQISENLDAEVIAVSETSVLVAPPPDWRDFLLRGLEVQELPKTWAAQLAEWRGIYLIVDQSDGERYVGAAYGVDNLLGRWRKHVARNRGITKELSKRDPRNFQFSILERVSPDAGNKEVVALERGWMARLDTIRNGLNA